MTSAKIGPSSVTKERKKKKKIVDKEDSEDEADASLQYPLMPNDPSAGFIEVQGHYILHLTFFIALAFFVKFDGEIFCFNRKAKEWLPLDNFDVKPNQAYINDLGQYFMIMHLLIFFFQFFGMYTPQKRISNNLHISRKLFIFASSPFYIYLVFMAQRMVHDDSIKYVAGSSLTDYTISGPVCIAQKEGTIHYWLQFEIFAFYANILVLIMYLVLSRWEDSTTQLSINVDQVQQEIDDLLSDEEEDDEEDQFSNMRIKIVRSKDEEKPEEEELLDSSIRPMNPNPSEKTDAAVLSGKGLNQNSAGNSEDEKDKGNEVEMVEGAKQHIALQEHGGTGLQYVDFSQNQFVDKHSALVDPNNADATDKNRRDMQKNDETSKGDEEAKGNFMGADPVEAKKLDSERNGDKSEPDLKLAQDQQVKIPMLSIEEEETVDGNKTVLKIEADLILQEISAVNFQHDLLISFKQERQFNKLTVVLILINIFTFFIMKQERTPLANSDWEAKQLNDLVATQLTQFTQCTDFKCNMDKTQKDKFQKFGLKGKDSASCGTRADWIFVIMIINHLIQLFLSATYIGTKIIHSTVPRGEFRKGFIKVAIIFLIMNIVSVLICIPIMEANTTSGCHGLMHAWLWANFIASLLLIPNIYFQYTQNQRKSMLVIQYAINTLKKEMVLEQRAKLRDQGKLSNVKLFEGGHLEMEGGDTIESPNPNKENREQKITYEIRNDKLALTKDIYSYTFFCFVNNHNPVILGELMIKCFFTIMLQLAIIYYKFASIALSEAPVYRGSAGLNVVRLICSFVMHLYTYPEIRLSQQMLQYSLYNSFKFPDRSAFFPLMLTFMKITGAFISEYGNIFNIMRYDNINSVIGGYITMSIISKIDDIMAKTLTSVDIGGEYSANPLMYRRKQNIHGDLYLIQKWKKHFDLNPLQWVLLSTILLVNRLIRFLYVTVYYYFLPFIITVWVQFSVQPNQVTCAGLSSS